MPTIKTASGNPIAITDSANAPLQGLRVYGKTTQSGTPTPDAPVPLVSVGGDGAVVVTVEGKNLLDASAYMQDGDGMIKIPYSSNNSIALEFAGIRVYRGQRYTFSYKRIEPTGDRVILMFLDRNGERIGDVDVGWGAYLAAYGGVYGSVGSGATFTIPQDSNVAYLQIRMCKMNTCGEGNYNYYYDLQLEVGSTATAYEPYKSPRTLTLSTPNGLPGIPVSSGGNYTDADGQQWICDEIDLERGVHVQRIKRFSLPVATMNNNEDFPGWQRVEGLRECLPEGVNDTRYKAQSNVGSLIGFNTRFTNAIVMLAAAVYGMTQSEWMTNYPDLVVEFMLPLLTPIETPLSAEEIVAYKALKTNHPNTTIMSNEDAWLYAAYIQQQAGFTTYWTDPKTNWKNGDHFNLDPDYERIKNNITYVQELTNKVNARVEIDAMGDYTITEYPLAAFLNTIATNIEKLSKSMFLVTPTVEMPMHVGNGPGWTAEELNDIEGNLLNMYEELNRQYALVPRLDIMMGIGGINFGS